METGYTTVADDVPNAVIDAFNCHEVGDAFQHLQIDSAVTAFISRFGNNLRTEFASNVCFLLAVDVCMFCVAHPSVD